MTVAEPVTEAVKTDWAAVAREVAGRFRDSVAERERAYAPPHEELQAVREARIPNLLIPREYGGEGGTYADAVRVIGELAAVDPNVGALVAYHYTNFIPALLDYETGNADLQRRSAENRWIWGNVTQPWVPFRADPTPDGGFLLNGVKPYNTGVVTGDIATVLVPRSDKKDFVYLAVPRDRAGLVFHDDWGGFGLTRTETVTITFDNVTVRPDEVYIDSHPGIRDTFPPYYLPLSNLNFAAILVGAAQGALRAALDIVRTSAPAATPDDGDVAEVIGRAAARVRAMVALRDQVAAELQAGFERRRELSTAEIVDHIQRSETLRLYAARAGLEVTSEIFEIPDVAERAADLDLDRFWRDIRIHSLHVNPTIYHSRVVGDTLLNGSEEVGPPFFV